MRKNLGMIKYFDLQGQNYELIYGTMVWRFDMCFRSASIRIAINMSDFYNCSLKQIVQFEYVPGIECDMICTNSLIFSKIFPRIFYLTVSRILIWKNV